MAKSLHSLELHGLKTFATITRLEFPGRITAIVGPNGSGKSNIADSVRWVLGEQSFSLLRAKRTEDLIFSGSNQKSRAGMASATITFNNETGWLPLDYSSVSITRRAYRDGQNEYLINGQKVRLKEISELLSQTGLSERTYTIIGQGLVDVALALKPDERRKLFEEAAGIGIYRSRKEESIRRLEQTRKNLDRVLDIMTEIKPRLRSLEKQSERVEEFQRLRADLEVLLREWYGYHWHQKQQDFKNVRHAFQDQEKRLSSLRGKNSELENRLKEAQEELRNKRMNLEEAHRNLSEKHQHLELATRKFAILEERQRSNKQQSNHLEIDVANLEQEVKALKQQDQNYQEEIDDRVNNYEDANKEVQQIENKLSDVSSNKTQIQEKIKQIQKHRVAWETEQVQLKARLQELHHRETLLNGEKEKIEKSIEQIKKEIDDVEKRLLKLEETYKQAKEAYLHQKNKRDLSIEKLDLLQKEQRLLIQQISEKESESARLQAQMDVIEQAEASLSGYSEGSKTFIEESQKGHLPAGIEPLAKHILIDEKFEQAISSSLGEFSDLLVVPSGNKGLILKYLDSKEHKRVALVELNQQPEKQQQNKFKNKNKIFGFANELIKVDKPYKTLVDNLFSNILVVDSKETAFEVLPDLNAHEKVVTLNGLVLHANGIIISGRSPVSKRIGRIRKLNEIKKSLDEVEELLMQLSENKASLLQKIKVEQNNYDQLLILVNKLEEENTTAENIFQETKDHQARLQDQLAWHQERISSVQDQFSDLKQTRISCENRLDELGKLIKEQMIQEEKSVANLNELPIFELQQELNHWQTHAIVAKNALKASQQRYQDHKDRFAQAVERLAVYQNRLTEIQSESKTINMEKDKIRGEVEELSKSIEEIEAEGINPLTETCNEIEQTLSGVQKMSEHSHQQVIIAERQYTQLQLELDRRQDQLNTLRERIEDDFGLVSLDYDQNVSGLTPLPFDDELVKNLPAVDSISEPLDEEIKRLKGKIRRIGAINPEAQQEYIEVKDRYEFLTDQIEDLEQASDDLREVIEKLDRLMERDFLKTFEAVNQEFSDYFSRLFNGGEAQLMFSDESNPVEGGVDIEARLPGRRSQGLALLSGGERSLTAVALIFSLLKVSPTPFCILDEVDAMLDESNVGRFIDLLRELAKKTQFVIITHNRNTVQAADVIYGVTMGRDSTSQMISLKLDEVDETYVE